jgi:hypothetical protein
MNANYYIIAGFDLTKHKTDKFEDWRWSDEGEAYFCNQRKGRIQLFDDPMSGDYLYLGYILAAGDEYDFPTTMFNADLIELVDKDVMRELMNLSNFGVIGGNLDFNYKVIAFVEYT